MAKLPPLISDQTAHVDPASGKPSKEFYNWLKQISSLTSGFITADQTVALLNKTFGDPTDILGGVTVTLGSDATGDIWYRSAGGLLTRLPIGSSGQVLTAHGSPLLPSWQNASIGLNYLGTVSVSGGTLSDTTILAANNSAYRSFHFIIKSLVPGTASVSLQWQVHSGGAFQTANYLASVQYASAVSFTNCIPLANGPNAINNADPGFSGDLTVSNLAGTSGKKSWFGKGVHETTTPGQANVSYSGWWNGGNGAIDGFQIVPSSGVLASGGSVDIYGIL